MRSPDRATSDIRGVFLEVTRPAPIVSTNAFTKGWQPQKPFMVGIWESIDDGAGGTHYRAAARHWDEATMNDHAAMGFEAGWGAVADQLLEVAWRVAAAG